MDKQEKDELKRQDLSTRLFTRVIGTALYEQFIPTLAVYNMFGCPIKYVLSQVSPIERLAVV